MKIVNSEVNIYHKKIADMGSKSIEIEELLASDFVTPFTILPIPDNAPSDIPRLIGKSAHGHSEIQLAQKNTKVIINFDEDFSQQWQKCKKYILQKIETLYSILDSIIEKECDFIGVTVNIQIDDIDAIELLRSKFINVDKNSNLEELSTRVAFVEEDQFFVNVMIDTPTIDVGDKTIKQVKLVKVVGISIDINDKYNFKNHKGFASNFNTFVKILDKMDVIIDSKIDRILKDGVIKI